MTAYGTPGIQQTALDVIACAQGARFTRWGFYNAMQEKGFADRLEVGRLFSRFIDEGRIVKAGKCGLAFEYKRRKEEGND